jgi:two-component system, OmpR family, sensor kinase
VPEAELTSLFRPFFRGSNAARAEGHGLGLAIVQRVAKIHGGDLRAANREGGGLDVHLRLPLAPADALAAQSD